MSSKNNNSNNPELEIDHEEDKGKKIEELEVFNQEFSLEDNSVEKEEFLNFVRKSKSSIFRKNALNHFSQLFFDNFGKLGINYISMFFSSFENKQSLPENKANKEDNDSQNKDNKK